MGTLKADEKRLQIGAHHMINLPPANVRRALRCGAGVTLAQLADAVGVSVAATHYWERGAVPRRAADRAAYASLLRAWAEQLCGGLSETLGMRARTQDAAEG
jgi:hypothetical protein